MLYECLTGQSPFAAEVPYALMHAILTASVAPPSQVQPSVEPSFDAIVLRAMARDPKARYPSLRALSRALRVPPFRDAPTPKPESAPAAVPTEPFHEVVLLEPRIVLVRRSARKFVNQTEVEEEGRRMALLLDNLGRKRKRLLVDSRRAPLNTDDRFAAAFTAMREDIGREFERTAVVVDSKIGILQANRLNRETALEGAIATFESESEALAFLKK